MEKLSKWLIIAAVISLPIKRGIIKPYSLQLFEFLIILATITLLIFLITERDNKRLATVLPWIKLSAFFMAFLILGSFFGYALYGTSPIIIKNTIVDLSLLLTTLSAFLLIIYHGKNNLRFRKHILLGFLSSTIFIPFVFMPAIANKLTFLQDGSYFWGLHQGIATFAGFMLIPLTYLTVLFVKEKFGFKKIFYWAIATLMFSIILWTGIRSAWLGMFLIISFITTYLAWKENGLINKLKHAIKLVLIFSISAVISFYILPNMAKTLSVARLFPQFKESDQLNLKISIPNQTRGEIWPQAIKLLFRSPFGLGTQYHETSKAIGEPFKDHLGNYQTRYTGAHNAFLATGLMGGVGALMIFIFIIYMAIKNIIRSANKDIEWMVLGGNLIGLLTIAFFQGIMLGFPWAWIILALIFARETTPNSLR